MDFIDFLVKEYEHEMRVTRTMLERVPNEHWSWKPHPKSMTLGMLASHIAESQGWAKEAMTKSEFVFDTATYKPFQAANRDEVLAEFDRQAISGAKSIMTASSESLAKNWQMKMPDGTVILEMTRLGILRDFVINHTIHHRGQLTVYLRMKDVPLPQVYGPTADDTAMKG